MECNGCDIIKKRNGIKVVYEDEKTLCYMNESPISNGHVIIIPKEHYVNIDEVPEGLLNHMMFMTTFICEMLFEIKDQKAGTNVIINDGKGANRDYPHFSINIVLREENDNISFKWNLNPSSAEELEDSYNKIKNISNIKTEKKIEKHEDNSVDDFMIRQLNRMP
jgi:histidine triad (HIT) family protein